MTRRVPFEEGVEQRGPDECWPWRGKPHSGGYGRITNGGRLTYAHRVAYEVAYGPVPDGLCVLHRCDNPPCCNPAHLWIGTKGDNNRDASNKGRYANRRTRWDARKAAA